MKELEELRLRIDCTVLTMLKQKEDTLTQTADDEETSKKANEDKVSQLADDDKVDDDKTNEKDDKKDEPVEEIEKINDREWRRVKLDYPIIKLTNDTDFRDWLTHVKAAASAADVSDLTPSSQHSE